MNHSLFLSNTFIIFSLNNISLSSSIEKRSIFFRKPKQTGYPKEIKRIFNTQDLPDIEPWVLSITYPTTISPSDVGGDKEDLRSLSIRVHSLIIKQI